MKDTYQPIDCNFYDRLEAWATQKAVVHIQYRDEKNDVWEISTQIKDLFIKDKIEFALLSNQMELRLDSLIAVNGIEITGTCSI